MLGMDSLCQAFSEVQKGMALLLIAETLMTMTLKIAIAPRQMIYSF